MIFQNTVQNTAISGDVVTELREIEKKLGGVEVHNRPLNEQEEAQKELEKILIGDGKVYLPFAKRERLMDKTPNPPEKPIARRFGRGLFLSGYGSLNLLFLKRLLNQRHHII